MPDDRPTRVLAVDDELVILEGIAAFLEDYDYSVLKAGNGREGLEVFRLEKPDLVLLDLWMPEMSGLDVLAEIRAESPDTPVIVVSGAGVISDVVKALRLGAWDYIIKPIQDMNVLHHAVEKALERARLVELKRSYQEHLEKQVADRTRNLTETNEQLQREIQTRIRAEKELEASERMLDSIIRTVPDVIYRLSPEGRITFISDAVRKYGQTPQGLIGDHFLEYVHPADRSSLADLMGNPATTQPGRKSLELRLFAPETEVPNRPARVFQVDVETLHDEKGNHLGWQGIARDISDRRQLEEQLLHSQKMEAFGQLAGGVAHDFNNMLAVIQGYSQMAARCLDDPTRLSDCLAHITQAGEKAGNLTRQLLIFSRKQPIHPQVLDLNLVIDDMGKMLRRVLREDIRLVIDQGPDLDRVRVDKGHVEQIIMNLTVNARDALESGGEITIGTSNVSLPADDPRCGAGLRPGAFVRMIVKDNGVGMTREVRRRIFEPFFTTKPEGKGTGLGLATVYGIVQQSQGYVGLESEPGRGTTFEILLPRAASAHAVEAESVTEEIVGGGETILLAEDDDGVRSVIRDFLEDIGYRVLCANDATQALRISHEQNGHIHLLLVDQVMPGMRGTALVREIRKHRPAVKVVLMSGHAETEVTKTEGLDDTVSFLRKPFKFHQLAGAIRGSLDRPTSD